MVASFPPTSFYRVHWYPPKKYKYGKPRLGESTSTGKRRQSCKTRQDKARMDPATNWRCHTIAKNVFDAGWPLSSTEIGKSCTDFDITFNNW